MRSPIVLAASLAVAALLALLATLPAREARAAAPWFIIVEGSLLDAPVVLDDWRENQALLLSDEPPLTEAERTDRPSLSLRPLWGPEWEQYPRDAASLREVAMAAAPVQGRFYPAIGERPAALTLQGAVHREGSPALAALARRGVPMRVEAGAGTGEAGEAGEDGVIVGALLALATSLALGSRMLVPGRTRTSV